MTEHEWATSQDPRAMLDYLVYELVIHDSVVVRNVPLVSDRKLRLFACACRRLTNLPWDGASSGWRQMEDHPEERVRTDMNPLAEVPVIEHARLFLDERALGERLDSRRLAALLREIVGNPYNSLPYKWEGRREGLSLVKVTTGLGREETVAVGWLTPTVVEMARYAYENRDFTGLPVVADALEEAGCTEDLILEHLRGQTRVWDAYLSGWRVTDSRSPHVRGCWAIDLLLGLE